MFVALAQGTLARFRPDLKPDSTDRSLTGRAARAAGAFGGRRHRGRAGAGNRLSAPLEGAASAGEQLAGHAVGLAGEVQ